MDCPLCQMPKNVVWSNQNFYIVDGGNDHFPAYLKVISQRHVLEMSELTAQERTQLLDILLTIETLYKEELKPAKVNWAQFGNVVNHLHWHIIARWKDDSHYPNSAWEPALRSVDPTLLKTRQALMETVKKQLIQKLSAF